MQNLKKKLNESLFNNEYSKNIIEAEVHFKNIYKECGNKFLKNCGSYLIDGQSYNYCIDFYPKQKFLFDIIKKRKKDINVLEIGTYMGHSLMLMLIANKYLSITCVDIDDTFSKPATEYLKKNFPHAKIEFIKGDSLKIIKSLKKKYDLFLIDGTHRNTQVTREFTYCINNLMNTNEADFILDDITHAEPLKKNIFFTFSIKETESFNVPNGNLFFQIELPTNFFKLFFKNKLFNFLNLLWYLKKKLIKIVNFKKI